MLADRINQLAASETLEMTRKSQEMAEQGMDVINLSIGEPDFFTPPGVKDAGIKAIENNVTHYSPIPGYKELRQAIVKKLKRDNNLDYTLDQIVVSNGAKHALSNVIFSIINPGDEVILIAPYWVTYAEQVKFAGGRCVVIRTSVENDFKTSPEELEKHITSRTKAIIICSPSNPTGSVYTKKELQGIAKVIAKFQGIYVISDEIYEYINFTGAHHSIAENENIKQQVIVVNGVSKGYAMTGWRIGYIAAPLPIAQACTKIQGQLTSGASSISQMATIAALQLDKSEICEMVDIFKKRRDYVHHEFKKMAKIKVNFPNGAFYVFPDISSYYGTSYQKGMVHDARDLAFYLLEEARVATVPGIAFGCPDCIRISYATSDEKLKEGMKRVKKALNNLT